MEQDDGGTSSSYIDPVTIHKWYIRRPWIYCTIPLQDSGSIGLPLKKSSWSVIAFPNSSSVFSLSPSLNSKRRHLPVYGFLSSSASSKSSLLILDDFVPFGPGGILKTLDSIAKVIYYCDIRESPGMIAYLYSYRVLQQDRR